MANSTQPVDAPIREGVYIPMSLAAVQVYKGCAAAIVNGVGNATPLVASNTSSMTFVGVFTETYNGAINPFTGATATAGSYFTTLLRAGCVQWAQTGTTITAANIGQNAYFSDDHTITLTPGTIYAGEITTVDANGNVWVDISNATIPYTASGPILISTLAPAVTITNVNGSAQVLASATVPANQLQVGDRIKIRGELVGVTRTASDTIALNLSTNTSAVPGGTLLFTLASAFAHATTNFLYFDTEVVVQNIGATGNVSGGGLVVGGTAGATTTGLYVGNTAVATNAALVFELQGTFSANNTTDQVSVNIFDVDVTRV